MEDSILIKIINQIHDLQSKLVNQDTYKRVDRNFSKISDEFNALGYKIYNPISEKYDETRNDCEATIMNNSNDMLHITEVIKPAIYKVSEDNRILIQKAVVIVA